MAAENIAFITLSTISFILLLLPFPWHWNARNYGTILYMAWVSLGSVVYTVDAIIWNGNLSNPAPIWCDISTKIQLGVSIALPAVSLCINRRLFNIATMKHASATSRERRNQMLIDLGIGLGIPLLVMALHYVVQGHRYNVVEDIGCVPTYYVTPITIPLILLWAPILGLISMVYSLLSMRAFLRQRRNFKTILDANQGTLQTGRFIRLMALAGADVLFSVPLSTFFLWSNTHNGLNPWISWADTHYNFSYIEYVPLNLIKQERSAWATLCLARWFMPFAAISFFIFFGFSADAVAGYKAVGGVVLAPFRRFLGFVRRERTPQPTNSPPNFSGIRIQRSFETDVESLPETKFNIYVELPSPPLPSQMNSSQMSHYSSRPVSSSLTDDSVPPSPPRPRFPVTFDATDLDVSEPAAQSSLSFPFPLPRPDQFTLRGAMWTHVRSPASPSTPSFESRPRSTSL